MNFLIIGSGPAGIFAAEAIRRRDRESSLTIVSEDRGLGLSPVMLTYWMAEVFPRENLFFRSPSWAEQKRVDMRLGVRATSLSPSLNKVILSEGSEISCDRLLIATGSVPISLNIPGIHSKGVSTLRTLTDAETILEGQADIREFIIIGGGFIGLKLACHLKEKGLHVAVLEKEPKLAPRMLDRNASRVVEGKLKQHGIRVEIDVEVSGVLDEKERVTGVQLKDGRIFPCQRVVQAVGVRPNTGWLHGSGIDLKGGILVDERMETNIPGIYAAGDVAMTVDPITSEWVNNATWSAATRQGAVAGSNMAGTNRTYTHNFAINALTLFDLKVMVAGHAYYEETSELDVTLEEREGGYRKIVVQNGRLIGFILIGDVSGAGFLLSLMKKRVELPSNQWDRVLSCQASKLDLPPHLGFDHGLLFQGGKGLIT